MSTRYFLAFASSPQLEQSTIMLLERFAANSNENLVPHLEKSMDLFIPELLQAFLVGTVDAIGLSPMASKIVHSTADIIEKTANMLVGRMLKKRTNDELKPMVGFVDDIYVRPETASTGKASTGCEIDKADYDRMHYVITEIRAGNGQKVLKELHDLLTFVVDIMLEKMMKRPIDLLPLNFVVRKIADGATATCRAAGHGVVNKVFKKLDNDQLVHLANYFDSLVLTVERP